MVMQTRDEACNRTTNDDVGKHGQDGGNDQHLEDVDDSVHDDLIDRVENAGEDEDLSDVAPGVAQQAAPLGFVSEGSPEKGGTARSRVSHAGANGEEDSNERLNDDAEVHRADNTPDEVLPYALKYIAHR